MLAFVLKVKESQHDAKLKHRDMIMNLADDTNAESEEKSFRLQEDMNSLISQK